MSIALTFCLVFVLHLGSAKAGPSQYYFDSWGSAYIEVADLGEFATAQWQVLALIKLSELPDPKNVGLGFSFYHPKHGDLCLHIVRDETYWSHSWEGVWEGSGSKFVLSTSGGYMDYHQLWTTPPKAGAYTASDNPTLLNY